MWFEELTGFREESPQQVRQNMAVDGPTLTSRVNGRTLVCGELETPTLGELRERVRASCMRPGTMRVRETVADVQSLHAQESNAGAIFQVASQFNLLEMTSPRVTPEEGIGIYQYDRTQGPACAIAAGAGTIYRNYFAPVDGQIGQSVDKQIDCLEDMGNALQNAGGRLWKMQNGYALASEAGLSEITRCLQASTEEERDHLRASLRIGLQWGTQVTLGSARHTVSQVYCSALPVAYSRLSPSLWEPFARLILEAAYEATLCAAVLNAARHGNKKLFLTLLGGGAFGNHPDWILDGIVRALQLYKNTDLEIEVVSYGSSNPGIRRLVQDCQW